MVTTILLVLVLLTGIALRGIFAHAKNTWHVDEGITVAMTNGNWAPGKGAPVEDEWVSADELHNLTFNYRMEAAKDVEYDKISRSTAFDVHPPLYYWVFAKMRHILGVRNYLFTGYLLNIILFAISALIFGATVRLVFREPLTLLFCMCCFVFSSGTLSMTIFLRMYEMLQTFSLLFFASALLVVFSKREGRTTQNRVAMLAAGTLGLAVSSYLGLLTQYYFLLFIVPVCIAALVYLVYKKDFTSLMWGLFAVIAGLLFSYKTFPAMIEHLTGSYRAKQSMHNLAKSDFTSKLLNLLTYESLVSKNLIPFALLIAVIALAGFIYYQNRKAQSGTKKDKPSPDEAMSVVFYFSTAVLIFTLIAISFSAPYKTVRYVVSFFPVYILAFAGFVYQLLPRKKALIMLCAAALWVTLHGAMPANLCHFHEDYELDKNPYYMNDNNPLIIVATPQGISWKNMLPYINLRGSKPVYLTELPIGTDVTGPLLDIAKTSGGNTVYALVDNYIKVEPKFERIGWYGFYHVYKIDLE